MVSYYEESCSTRVLHPLAGMAIYLRDYGNVPEAQKDVDDYF